MGIQSLLPMTRTLAFVLGVTLVATTADGLGADFEVGRATLRVSDDGWASVAAAPDELRYSGDWNISGAVEAAKRSLVLVDSENRFRAALVIRASRGVPTIHIQWPDDCKSQTNVYAVDARQGSVEGRDCLRVSGLVSIQRYLAASASAVAADLAQRRTVVPTAGYVVVDEVALVNGAFVTVQAAIAADVDLPAESTSQQTLPAGIRAEVVAWGQRLAEAARSSVHSLSGLLVVPAVTAKTH
jgi:hypothetical protein